MALLEEIKTMRAQGLNDEAIVQNLKEHSVSPKEIADALGQEKIRQAVTEDTSTTTDEEMQPSMGSQETPSEYNATDEQAQNSTQSQAQYNYTPEETYAPLNTDTMSEIAEQTIMEKLQPIERNLDKLLEFKNILEEKTRQFDARLQKIEKVIDALNLAIIKKIGEYGENIGNLKKEMIMTQDAFKKVIEPTKTDRNPNVREKRD